MLTRRERRRLGPQANPRLPLPARIRQWVTSWNGIISLSVALVVVVVAVGALRPTLPFGIGQTPPTPDPWGNVSIAKGASPKIVYIGNTANGAPIDAAGAQQAIQYAIDESIDIKGFKPSVGSVGDNCDPNAIPTELQGITSDPTVVGVVASTCTSSTLALALGLAESHIPFISLNETSPGLTAANAGHIARLTGNQTQQAQAAATFARTDLLATKAIILFEDNPDATAVADAFRAQFRTQGGSIIDSRNLPADGQWDAIVKEAQDFRPDVLYVSSNGKLAGDFLKRLRAAGVSATYMVTQTAYNDPEYLLAGTALEGTYATTIQVNRAEKYAGWKEAFEKQYLAVGPLSAEAYDASGMIIQALGIGAKPNDSGALEVGKQTLNGLVRGVRYDGVTGPTTLNSAGDRTSVLVPVMKYEEGVFKQVK